MRLRIPAEKTTTLKATMMEGEPRRTNGIRESFKDRTVVKETLNDLNERLESYISRIKSLERENKKLEWEKGEMKNCYHFEVNNVKEEYSKELTSYRTMTNEASKENSSLELTNKSLKDTITKLNSKISKEQCQAEELSCKIESKGNQLKEKEAAIKESTSTLSGTKDQIKDLESKLKKSERALQHMSDGVRKERSAYVSAENRYEGLKKELEFSSRLHDCEMENIKEGPERNTLSAELQLPKQLDFDDLLESKLSELRDDLLKEGNDAKKELEEGYKRKLKELKDENGKNYYKINDLLEKESNFRLETERLRSQHNMLSSKINRTQKEIAELEMIRSEEESDFKVKKEKLDADLMLLEDKFDDMEKEYASLRCVKIALDVEFEAYNKLLEGEEERFKIEPPASSSFRGGNRRKRKNEGPSWWEAEMFINDVISVTADTDGFYVALTNHGDEERDVSGYCVQRLIAGNNIANSYSFSDGVVLKSKESIPILSKSQRLEAMPPNSVLLNGDWCIGERCITTIVTNAEDVLVAKQVFIIVDEVSKKRMKMSGRDGKSKNYCMIM